MVKRPPNKGFSGEKLSKYVAGLFRERGKEALEIARKVVMGELEKLNCKEVREALKYFINDYWKETTRAALISITCEALGGEHHKTVHIAVPLILISGAIDIHDDIIDRTEIKRTGLTVYGKFGGDIALLVGDALLFKGLSLFPQVLGHIEPEKLCTIVEVLKSSFFELGDAEAMETSLRRRKTTLAVDEYMEYVKKKAAEVEAYMRIAAIMADASTKEIEAIARYGRILGMLIIIGDDNSDTLNPRDLINRVKHEVLPLPLIYALNKAKVRRKLIPILRRKKLTERDAKKILDIVFAENIFDEIERDYIAKLIDEGLEALKTISLDSTVLNDVIKSTYPKD
ncbi:MAG: polyprenyl synthetase family protein [Nitrososphaerota archaeon]|nr:polyprenyl synthetase family protein [Nitrososphaerota archaeon]